MVQWPGYADSGYLFGAWCCSLPCISPWKEGKRMAKAEGVWDHSVWPRCVPALTLDSTFLQSLGPLDVFFQSYNLAVLAVFRVVPVAKSETSTSSLRSNRSLARSASVEPSVALTYSSKCLELSATFIKCSTFNRPLGSSERFHSILTLCASNSASAIAVWNALRICRPFQVLCNPLQALK